MIQTKKERRNAHVASRALLFIMLGITLLLPAATTKGEEGPYDLSEKIIERQMKIGTFTEIPVYITNRLGTTLSITAKLDGNISDSTKLEYENIQIPPYSRGNITLIIFANDMGTYSGGVLLHGDIEETIPLNVIVKSVESSRIGSLLMEVEPYRTSINPSKMLQFEVNLHNLISDTNYPVTLTYMITSENDTPFLEIPADTIELSTTQTLIKEKRLPPNTSIGDYKLTTIASYLNLTQSNTHLISVRQMWYKYELFGIIPMWWFLPFFTLIGGGIGTVIYVRKQIEAKKRFHLKVDYNTLPKPGTRSLYVGKIAETEHKTYIDMDTLQTHTIIAGSTGGGKSVSAQVIIEEALDKGTAIIVFDPTAQWSGMLRKLTNKKMLTLYPQFGLTQKDAKAYNGNVKAINNPRELIDLKKYLKPGEIQIFTLNRLDPKDIDTFTANTVRQVFAQNFPETQQLTYMLVYDEVHRLLPKFGGSGQGFLQIERACREFRKWGIGVMLVSQVLSDFVGQIKANINTEIQMRTRDEGDLERIKTKYGGSMLQSLVKANVGAGMAQNANNNHGQPYFIQFRPLKHDIKRLTDEELDQYNKYNDQIEDLEYQLTQLKTENIDTFDLQLELKLALDKVKTGNFNMVDIYLEGLKPRITKHWQKIGKSPKQKIVKLVEESALQEELAKAQAERAKFMQQLGIEEEKKEEAPKETVPLYRPFIFDNGAICGTVEELADALSAVDMEIFRIHVNEEKNDIVEWLEKLELKRAFQH